MSNPTESFTPSESVLLADIQFAPPRSTDSHVRLVRNGVWIAGLAGMLLSVVLVYKFELYKNQLFPLIFFGLYIGMSIVFGWALKRVQYLDDDLVPSLQPQTGQISTCVLAWHMICAALLGLESRGACKIVFKEDHEGSRLIIVPGESVDRWPSHSLESRLCPSTATSLTDLLEQWLVKQSHRPCGRVVEHGRLMLVIRGLAALTESKGVRSYCIDKSDKYPSTEDIALVTEMFARCRESRPKIWSALEGGIQSCIKNKMVPPDTETSKFVETDPWSYESFADQKKYLGYIPNIGLQHAPDEAAALGESKKPTAPLTDKGTKDLLKNRETGRDWVAIPIGLVLAGIDWFLIQRTQYFHLAMITSLLLILSILTDQKQSIYKRILGMIAGVPAMLMVVLSLSLMIHATEWRESEYVLIAIVSLVGTFFIILNLREWARVRISSRVQDITLKLTGKNLPQSDFSKDFKESGQERDGSVEIELLHPNTIPESLNHAHTVATSASARGGELRRAHRRPLIFLAALMFIFVVVDIQSVGSLWSYPPHGGWLLIWIYLALFTILLCIPTDWLPGPFLIVFFPVIYLIMGDERRIVRPWGLDVLWAGWLFLSLGLVYTAFIRPLTANIVTAGAGVLAFALVFLVLRIRLGKLEAQYPYTAPASLVVLRVFGSVNLQQLLQLTDSWSLIGPTFRLEGPDTVGEKLVDVFNVLSGRIDKSIVSDPDQVHNALSRFKLAPDRSLRFPVNSIQCTDATWKVALEALLDEADVVVADLSNQADENLGIAYELERLIERVPIERVLLLVRHSTNMELSRALLAQAHARMTSGSPNADGRRLCVRMLVIDHRLGRSPKESSHQWEERQSKLEGDDFLVGLLYSMAETGRDSNATDRPIPERMKRWARG